MKDLIELLSQFSINNIKTYIQSGNVCFQGRDDLNVNNLELNIETAISKKYGFNVPAIIRTFDEFQTIINSNPFSLELKNQHYVTFTKNIVNPSDAGKIDAHLFLPDLFSIANNHIYIQCHKKYSDTKLNNTFFEKKLNVVSTTRNWKTIEKLYSLSKSN